VQRDAVAEELLVTICSIAPDHTPATFTVAALAAGRECRDLVCWCGSQALPDGSPADVIAVSMAAGLNQVRCAEDRDIWYDHAFSPV
jgi:hypothetical protein